MNAVKAAFRFLKILPLSYRGFDCPSAEFVFMALPDLLIPGKSHDVSMAREASVCSDKNQEWPCETLGC